MNEVSHAPNSLPNVEEDLDDVVSIEGSDTANVVDLDEVDLDQEEIPQLTDSDLDRLKAAMTAPLSPSQNEFLQWHVRLQHLPFPRMKRLAEKGVILAKFGKMSFPLCPWCIFGTQHKKPWRSSKMRVQIRRDDETAPGMCTSTDQLISAQGGLIPQRTRKLMSARYVGAIFVDHFSDYVYVHLMKEFTAEATLEAKNAWERLAGTHAVRIRRYRADNGRYNDALFLQDIKDNGQLITFCGVGAHHQNGIAERKIRDLTENARTQLVHAMHLWPDVITQVLWPFALKAVVRTHNKFKLDVDLLSPE